MVHRVLIKGGIIVCTASVEIDLIDGTTAAVIIVAVTLGKLGAATHRVQDVRGRCQRHVYIKLICTWRREEEHKRGPHSGVVQASYRTVG